MLSLAPTTLILCGLLASSASGYSGRNHRVRAEPGECTYTALPNSGDTCQSFSDWWGIKLADLVAFNPTLSCPTPATTIPNQEWCVEMILPPPSTTTTAVPTGTGSPFPSPTQENVTKECKAWYKIVKGDTCQKLVDRFQTFGLQDFYGWNPDVGTDCSGLPLDAYVCVGVSGTPTAPPTTSPTPTSDPSKPSPTQDNVTKDCKSWHKVVKGDTCQKVVDSYKTFTLTQFYSWNPDVGTDCSGLLLDAYVCVGVTGTPTSPPAVTTTSAPPSGPSPTQENVVKNCNNWYKVAKGDGCQKIVDKYGTFTLSQFYSWNPDVGTDCSTLPLDAYVCVGVPGTPTTRPASTPTTTKPPAPTVTGTNPPSPIQTGVSRTCNKWYYVISGDGCWAISEKFGITLSNFYKWNTAVKSDCSDLQVNVYVCVGST